MSGACGESANIAELFRRMAEQRAGQVAIKIPRGRQADGAIDYAALSFAELAAEAGAWQARLQAAGVRRGDRTLVMVRPGLPLVAATFALFAQGAVPVVIDPGMGWKSFLRCVARSHPRVLLGIPLAQVMSRIFRSAFRGLQCRVRASGRLTARLTSSSSTTARLEPVASAREELAAILFTSGSTGAPKGVRYEHGTLAAQVRLVRAAYGLEPGEIDLPLLPVFALFNPALGLTTIVPEIDPRRPAQVDPDKIVQAIQQEGVTNSFGSPTLWRKIADHCLARGITLPSLRRVLCAGAPVPESLWRDAPRFLPAGELHSPYGATEALPVSSIRGEDVCRLQGFESPERAPSPRGACVGQPLPGVEVRILEMTEGPLATLTATRELPPGEIGEIVVRGPMVSRAYDELPEATARAKIPVAGEALPWHRMGDCGYRDGEGRLWFCGRQVERVQTIKGPLFTEPCEQVFRRHPAVARCALVGLGSPGRQEPALVVQLRKPATPTERQRLARELGEMARGHEVSAAIGRCFFHPNFPVDVRHNAKIHRLALARWAEKARGYSFSAGER